MATKATLAPMSNPNNSAPLSVKSLSMEESYSNGWKAIAVIQSQQKNPVELEQVIKTVTAYGMIPGYSVLLSLIDGSPSGAKIRSWPSIVTKVKPLPTVDLLDMECQIELVDPISYLADRPIWGVFRGNSAGEILGGVLSMVTSGYAQPTLTPILNEFPTMTITETLREAAKNIPYAIACGQPLKVWIDDLFGRLGIYYKMKALSTRGSSSIEVSLSDQAPNNILEKGFDVNIIGYHPLQTATSTTETDFQVYGLSVHSARSKLGTVIDSPEVGNPKFFGTSASVDAVIKSDFFSTGECEYQANLPTERVNAQTYNVHLRSKQPNLSPGAILNIKNVSIDDAPSWQCTQINHEIRDTTIYENDTYIIKNQIVWRPRYPSQEKLNIISAFVYGGSDYTDGQRVPMNAYGRVGIVPAFINREDDNAPSETALELRILNNVAGGGASGFVSGCQHNDSCQIIVYHPMLAEILGFCHQQDADISNRFTNASAGICLNQGTENSWQGLFFSPDNEESEVQYGQEPEGGVKTLSMKELLDRGAKRLGAVYTEYRDGANWWDRKA